MVSIPSEQGVERSLLSWLDGVGWETHGQDGDRGANVLDDAYERQSHEVVYWNLLAEQVVALNEDVTEENVDKFISSLKRDLDTENLMDGNRAFHQLLTKEGVIELFSHRDDCASRIVSAFVVGDCDDEAQTQREEHLRSCMDAASGVRSPEAAALD